MIKRRLDDVTKIDLLGSFSHQNVVKIGVTFSHLASAAAFVRSHVTARLLLFDEAQVKAAAAAEL